MANYSRWEDVKKKRPAPDADTRAGVEQDLALGQLIYDLRTEAGLSQRELAERIGTTQSVISRLEEGGEPQPHRHPRPSRHRARPSPRRVVPREGSCQAQGRRASRLTAAGSSGQDFYTFFYTAGWDWLVRSGTDRHVECAKSQLSGTTWYGIGP